MTPKSASVPRARLNSPRRSSNHLFLHTIGATCTRGAWSEYFETRPDFQYYSSNVTWTHPSCVLRVLSILSSPDRIFQSSSASLLKRICLLEASQMQLTSHCDMLIYTLPTTCNHQMTIEFTIQLEDPSRAENPASVPAAQ